MNINVTKSFLPRIEDYKEYIDEIWESGQLTNQGQLVKKLETKLEKYLDVVDLHFIANGTIALQLSLRALGITGGEIITTPFSYVATVSSILWERCTPVFVDIDPNSLCIDPSKIESAITSNTKAIMPVHVFGTPCEIEMIEEIAKNHELKVIYDAAHAFGVRYKNKSLLNYGDISTCSFHATKLFHTIEGGAIVAKDKLISEKIELLKRFGHDGDEHFTLGINAKASEFQAAMGLCNLNYVDDIIKKRKVVTKTYDDLLSTSSLKLRNEREDVTSNYAYYPVVFENEKQLLHTIDSLAKKDIQLRRYFYPSLNTLSYIEKANECPISEDISSRIACLPLYPDLDKEVIELICNIIVDNDKF